MINKKSKSKTTTAISAPKKSKLPISEVVLIDMNAACIMLGKPAYAIYKLIDTNPKKNRIRHFRVAGKILFSPSDLNRFMKGKKFINPPFKIDDNIDPVIFDICAAGKFLNLSISKIYKMTSRGILRSPIPHKRNGGLIFFKKNDLIKWVNKCSIGVKN